MNCRFLYMYFRFVLPCNWIFNVILSLKFEYLKDVKGNTDSRTLVLMLCFPMKERQLRIIILGYMYSFDTIHTKFLWLQEIITFNQVRDNEFGPFTLVVKTLYIKLEIFKHCSCLVGTPGIFCTWNNIRVLVLELRITQYK